MGGRVGGSVRSGRGGEGIGDEVRGGDEIR